MSHDTSHDTSHDISFLERLLDAAGPSGFEVRAARVWREDAETFADSVHTDVSPVTRSPW